MAYIGSSPTKVVSRQSANIFTYTATANQTAFTGADTDGNTLACTPSDIMVHMNGLRLEESDYTASTTTVTLGSGAAAGDEVTITAFVTFETADAYTKSASDTRYVNTTGDTMTGNLGINGDLTVDTNALFVDASANKVGINTTTLNNALNVESASYQALGIKRNTGVTTGTGEFAVHMETNSQVSIPYDDEGSVVFGTATAPSTAAGFSEKVRINSAGIVTKPSHPSFSAYINGSNPSITSDNTKIPYNAVQWDIGNNFDETNHRYIAPVAGVYHFTVNHNVFSIANDYFFRTKIYVNAAMTSVLGYARAYNGGDHTVNDSILISLGAADTVEVYTSSNDTSYGLSAGIGWNTFSGFLVG